MRLPALIAGDRRAAFYLLLFNGLTQGVLAVLGAWLVMRIFDLLGTPTATLPLFLAGLAVIVVSSAWLRRGERIQAEVLGQRYVRVVRHRLYRRLLASNPREFKRRRKGSVLLKFVGDLSALRRWVSLGLARLLVAGVTVSIALSALCWLHWPFAAGVALILAVSSAWTLRHSMSLRAAIEETRRRQSHLASNVTEKINSLATVQAFGQMAHEHRLMRRQSEQMMNASVFKAQKIGSLRAVVDATTGANVLMVLSLAFILPPADLSPGMLAAVISIIGFLTPPLRDLGRVQEYWLAAQVARNNVIRISRLAKRVRDRRRGEALQVSQGVIELRNVSVRGALRRINAQAAGGSRIAVVGPNGSGKSTLLGLIGRMFDPDEGRIMIDGQNIAKVRLSSLRAQVAYVSADVPLIRGSLRKNLCYGAGRIEATQLQRVLQACELCGLVDRLPGGLDAGVAEDGANLSQGERVRVTLARALLRKPGILVLDEADANLDASARQALDANIKAFAGTVLMVSHRRSALRQCDTVWVLREGRLEQQSNLPPETNVVPLEVARSGLPIDRHDRLRGPLCG